MAKRKKATRRGPKRRAPQTKDDSFDEDGTEDGPDEDGNDAAAEPVGSDDAAEEDRDDDEGEEVAARPAKVTGTARTQDAPRAASKTAAANSDAPASTNGGLVVMGVVFALMVLAIAVQHFIE